MFGYMNYDLWTSLLSLYLDLLFFISSDEFDCRVVSNVGHSRSLPNPTVINDKTFSNLIPGKILIIWEKAQI